MPRILIVEDSLLSCRIAADTLQEAGYEVSLAENGEVGLKQYHEIQPDCIVSDLLMPVMEGQAMLGHLRELGSETPVIIASADIQQSSRELCEQLGISGFLNKPIKPEELLACVKKALALCTKEEFNEAK